MNIYADENMPLVREFFADLGEVTTFDGRNVQAEVLREADILLVRSVTPVNASLLSQNNRLRFVGTATIGTEHVDTDYLASRQISFSSAPGCNAQSVLEYVLSSLWFLAERYQWSLPHKVLGIVGVGSIGQRLATAAKALGIPLLLCDPLRAAQEADFPHTDFATLCQQADIISFHTPLEKNGPYPSYHLLDAEHLALLKPDCALINASRGAVIDNQALLTAQQRKRRPLVLDVWEQEPDILLPLLPYCDLATAHIAGHSVEGKARGTEMLYQRCCELLQQQPRVSLAALLPVPAMEKLQLSANFGLPDVQNLARMLYDVRRDDALFRYHITGNGFDWLRKSYPARREYSALQLSGPALPAWLDSLGFSRQ
ncbi:4-phosphoerythronate dehydrogenase [Alishewanella jeotgali]|uniref:Erythronate-4-phosphate dehydrogenase n=1 Tax=Alishewanella jeotgali KCTC 22429 TaxID=1129374 RepID=H3ZHJ6_9ALTE|nr:4-phosphoerythronate dehydrogenase [Alishewanella jeotgali]EHR39852.1 erythronate-4-phosphate dehydrogenase [Alishewanella jeotgali KCTC 22429]